MKNTRLAFVLAITSLTATPVIAASLTMLQFGSFETRDEADKRLGEIKSKYATSVGSLQTSIREIKLPPDNLTVYRTQAGPVASRADAQSICSTLSAGGDECYIVQTAMVNGPAPTAVAAASTATTGDSSLPTTSLLSDEKKDATDLTSKLSTLKDVPARDATSEMAINSVNSNLTTATPSDSPSPNMQAALDHAVSTQNDAEANVSNATSAASASAPSTSRSFWSRLNPFSSAAPAAVVAAPAKTVSPLAAPVDSVTSSAVDAPVAAAAISTPVVVAAAEPSPTPKPMPAFDNAPVITQPEPMRLPPPPAPLKAQDRADLAAGLDATKTPVATGAITAAPLPPTASPAMAAPTSNGVVNVEEAKRVPLTETVAPAPAAAPAPIKLVQPPISLSPSAMLGQKTLWAQIGPFTDAQTALEYWGAYRQNHPDFPVVRVRVTSPYQLQMRGVNQSWLRVGPIARQGFISSLCASLKDPKKPDAEQLRCGSVTDMGIASGPGQQPGMLPGSRYHR